LIRASFKASHGVYGARRVFLDLREAGETCSKHRVARLMRINNIRALYGFSEQTAFGALSRKGNCRDSAVATLVGKTLPAHTRRQDEPNAVRDYGSGGVSWVLNTPEFVDISLR